MSTALCAPPALSPRTALRNSVSSVPQQELSNIPAPSSFEDYAPPRSHGTKTRYVPVPSPPPHETPLHVSLLARHGTRNPTQSSIARMRTVASHLVAHGANREKLESWRRVIDEYDTKPGGLTLEGDGEMYMLGVRFFERYEPSISREGDPTPPRLRVRSSFKPRAMASAEAFVRGFSAAAGSLVGDLACEDTLSMIVPDDSASAIGSSTDSDSPPRHEDSDVVATCSTVLLDEHAATASGSSLSGADEDDGETADDDDEALSAVTDAAPIGDTVQLDLELGDMAVENEVLPPISPVPSSPRPTPPVSSDDEGTDSQDADTDSMDTPPPRADIVPHIQVLEAGKDSSLRFFEHHKGYAEFAREHKSRQRSLLLAQRLYSSRSRHARLASRIAAAFEVPKECLMSEHVRVLAESSAFDSAHGRTHSPLAGVLDDDDLRHLERFERRYRPFFEGHDRYGSVTAPLVKDLMDSLLSVRDNYTADTPFVAADMRFAHAETLMPLLLLLQIDSDGLPSRYGERKTGLSAMCPFAANLAIELFAPSSYAPHEGFRVKFRLHERYVSSVPALGKDGDRPDGFVLLDKLVEFFEGVLEENRRDPYGCHATSVDD